MCGPMRIVDRSGIGVKLLRGEGAWVLLRPGRLLLSWMYALFLALRMRRGRRPGAPPGPLAANGVGRSPFVISIGNLEVGGGGKTPCAIAIAEMARERGGRPVVLSRGYGGAASRRWAPFALPPAREADPRMPVANGMSYGAFLDYLASHEEGGARNELAAAVGDEIVLYHVRGIPVVVDRDRRRGASWARERFSPTHLLLDDAYHTVSLAKDADILLLDAERPFGNGRLLPLGTLREPPGAAARADAVIFTRAQGETAPAEAERFVRGKPVFFARHEPVDLLARSGAPRALSLLEGRNVVLFSGIARPASFEGAARALGARPAAAYRYGDHHRYTRGDIARMVGEGGAEALYLTTEKDWYKAMGLFPTGVEVLALRVRMRIAAPEGALERLLHLP